MMLQTFHQKGNINQESKATHGNAPYKALLPKEKEVYELNINGKNK